MNRAQTGIRVTQQRPRQDVYAASTIFISSGSLLRADLFPLKLGGIFLNPDEWLALVISNDLIY